MTPCWLAGAGMKVGTLSNYPPCNNMMAYHFSTSVHSHILKEKLVKIVRSILIHVSYKKREVAINSNLGWYALQAKNIYLYLLFGFQLT